MAVISGRIVAALLVELRSCVKVDVAVLGSPPIIVLVVYVDVEHHQRKKMLCSQTIQSRTTAKN